MGEGCKQVTNVGVGYLARGLEQLGKLAELKLDFVGCMDITDTGLERLVQNLPKSLRDLELHFDMCPDISNRGTSSLARQIATFKGNFRGTFKGTRVDKDFNSKAELLTHAKL